jgi:hypothetical protein
MKLSLKAVRFVIEALNHYQEEHAQRMNQPGLTEDELADLTSDRQFLGAIKRDFEQYHAELLRERDGIHADV